MRSIWWGAVALLLLVTAANAADVAKGKEVYDSRCAFCHGSSGKGDGPAGAALQPHPTNFAEPTFWQNRTPELVRTIIVSGKPGTAMIPFGQTLKPSEIDDLVAYMQTLK